MVSFDVLCLWVEVFEEEGEGRLYVRKRKYKEKEVGAICETSGETVIVWSSFFTLSGYTAILVVVVVETIFSMIVIVVVIMDLSEEQSYYQVVKTNGTWLCQFWKILLVYRNHSPVNSNN